MPGKPDEPGARTVRRLRHAHAVEPPVERRLQVAPRLLPPPLNVRLRTQPTPTQILAPRASRAISNRGNQKS